MDATKRPLQIPPEFALYAEKHDLFELYKRLLEQLLVAKPNDPLNFLAEILKREDNVPQIIVLGPPSSGKKVIGNMIAQKLGATYLTMDAMIQDADWQLKNAAIKLEQEGKPLPDDLSTKIVAERLKVFDCVRKGYVLVGFPETREQATSLQAQGICPKHCVILTAPDTVLVERAAGKHVDPDSGEIYHAVFDMPTDAAVAKRLVRPASCGEQEIVDRLVVYHRHIDGLTRCFDKFIKHINADQPKADVFLQALTYVSQPARSAAPRTPRIILFGPTGSGKSVQAALLASKYNLVNVSCGQLLKQAVAAGSKLGQACKTYLDKHMPVPDALVMSILTERLSQLDCVTRGWVLRGYPMTREQADELNTAGLTPNRVFCLDIPVDTIWERLTQRATDPVTGDHYHMLYNPPLSAEVKARLVVHPSDAMTEVQKRLSTFIMYQQELADYYEPLLQHVNGDQDPHTVFESLESLLVNPLPRKA